MENFTPVTAIIGGLLIGLSAAVMLGLNGRITGISGIFGGTLFPRRGELAWRVVFLVGMIAGGSLWIAFHPQAAQFDLHRSSIAIVVAGLLVGFGTRMGNGCTSGHGVCGNARFSKRSIVATLTFMATGGLTVLVVNTLLGGSV